MTIITAERLSAISRKTVLEGVEFYCYCDSDVGLKYFRCPFRLYTEFYLNIALALSLSIHFVCYNFCLYLCKVSKSITLQWRKL